MSTSGVARFSSVPVSMSTSGVARFSSVIVIVNQLSFACQDCRYFVSETQQ
jgi:hypothetical protein